MCESCKGCFCGFCFEKCKDGTDCHNHVLHCSLNKTESYYAPLSIFHELERKRKAEDIRKYVEEIDDICKEEVIIELKKLDLHY